MNNEYNELINELGTLERDLNLTKKKLEEEKDEYKKLEIEHELFGILSYKERVENKIEQYII